MLSQMEYKVVAEAYATKYNESMTKAKTLYSKDPIFSKHFEEQTKIITEYQKVRRKQKGFGLKTRHKAFLALIIFGSDKFIIPAMIGIIAVLTLMRKPLEKGGERV